MAIAAVNITSRDVQAILNYNMLTNDKEPYEYFCEPPVSVERTNVERAPRAVVIHDARGKEDTLSLDTTGFQFMQHVSAEKNFMDDGAIKPAYYREIEELLRKETGASRVFIFGHTIRGRPQDLKHHVRRQAVEFVHIDQTYESAVRYVRDHLPEEADTLLKGRVRIINVWRPISHPVAHKPLAFADWRTLDPAHDLVSMRYIFADRIGNTFVVRYNPGHRWYFMSDQTPEEVALFKIYDSKEDRARLAPHSAFVDKSSPPEAPQRVSIEVRAMVFSD